MSLELSNDQRQAVDAEGTPLKVLDPRTGTVYFLVDEKVHRALRSLFSDNIAETDKAQIDSARRAGWDDPVMDEYNDYDRHRNRDHGQESSARQWTEDKNRRRCELIDRDISGTITDLEAAELDALQREMLAYRRKVAPLPLDDLRQLHQDLLNRAAESRE